MAARAATSHVDGRLALAIGTPDPVPRDGTGQVPPAALAGIVACINKSKAPGVDGWRYSEQADWPPKLYSLLAEVFDLVELSGRWPDSPAPNVVCMLQKGSLITSGTTRLLQMCEDRCLGEGPHLQTYRSRTH